MIGDKIMCVGVGLQEYYCVCAIIGLLKKKQSPHVSNGEEQKAAYQVTQMTQKILSLQDNYSAAATLASLPNLVSISNFNISLNDKEQALTVFAQPMSASNGLFGSGNGNGNGIGHMDGTDILEVIKNSPSSTYVIY